MSAPHLRLVGLNEPAPPAPTRVKIIAQITDLLLQHDAQARREIMWALGFVSRHDLAATNRECR